MSLPLSRWEVRPGCRVPCRRYHYSTIGPSGSPSRFPTLSLTTVRYANTFQGGDLSPATGGLRFTHCSLLLGSTMAQIILPYLHGQEPLALGQMGGLSRTAARLYKGIVFCLYLCLLEHTHAAILLLDTIWRLVYKTRFSSLPAGQVHAFKQDRATCLLAARNGQTLCG